MTDVILAELSANVWKILVAVGDQVEEEQELMILESMKMEIPVLASSAGTVVEVLVAEGGSVNVGDPLVKIDEA